MVHWRKGIATECSQLSGELCMSGSLDPQGWHALTCTWFVLLQAAMQKAGLAEDCFASDEAQVQAAGNDLGSSLKHDSG